MVIAWLLYIGVGAVAGLLAGLLGVGGGIVIVPMLNFVFHWLGMPEAHIQHLALGTSLATIIFTSASSLRAHHRRGAVLWRVVLTIAPGIFLGTFLGAQVAVHLSKRFLTGFFVLFLGYVSAQMLLDIKPRPARRMPELPGMLGAGGVIGGVSSLVGIGGGTLSVPFLSWCNVPLHTCIGTSAAIGFPIAVAGALGYVFAGQGAALPGPAEGYLGFVYLPALIGVAAASVLTAPLGVSLSHSLLVGRLKAIFACLLLTTALQMLLGLF
jgi:uncharacterized membrane protein YfcA